jgi:hypothetical protein
MIVTSALDFEIENAARVPFSSVHVLSDIRAERVRVLALAYLVSFLVTS